MKQKHQEPVAWTDMPKAEPGKITGQLIHELANQKKGALGYPIRSWDEISAVAQETYDYVAVELEKLAVSMQNKQQAVKQPASSKEQ